MQTQQVVVTGGGGSLAKEIQSVMQVLGWDVMAPIRSELDVTDPKSVDSYFNDRPVDLLICTAGVITDTAIMRVSDENWDQMLAVNYYGAANCAAAVLPRMHRQRAGHIIFISSRSALHPPKGQIAYATAKAALIGLTTSLARQWGSNNIRVNTLLPGFLETRMTEAVTESRKAQILADHALGRFNELEPVARFIAYLHEFLPHTSGQVFQLDSRPA